MQQQAQVGTGPLTWCSLVGSVVAVFRALSSTGTVTKDVRGVTERCLFNRRRGCSRGQSRQQYQFRTHDKQPRPRSRVVLKQQNASSSKIGSMKTVVGVGYDLRTSSERVVNSVCERQRRRKKIPGHSALEQATKSHREPLLGTKSIPLSAFRHRPGPRHNRTRNIQCQPVCTHLKCNSKQRKKATSLNSQEATPSATPGAQTRVALAELKQSVATAATR